MSTYKYNYYNKILIINKQKKISENSENYSKNKLNYAINRTNYTQNRKIF